MRKILAVLLVVMISLSLVACNGGNQTNGKVNKRVIIVSTKFVDDEQTAVSLKKVVEAVNKRADDLELQLFTSGILPIGKDGMEQIIQGADWILVDGPNFLGDYIPDYNAIIGPFLYQSFDEYFAITSSPIVERLNKRAEEEFGIKVLSLDWVFGFRNMMTKKPIKTIEDMRGLRIRVPNSRLYNYTIEAMGASPVSMPYPDTYAALQQGVIDGLEGSIMTYYGTGQYENVKEYSLTRHLLGVSAIMISTKVWESLTEQQRTILLEEFEKGMEDNLRETIRLEKEYEDLLKAEGVTFHEVDDIESFRQAASIVFERFTEWTPGIFDEIQKELEKVR